MCPPFRGMSDKLFSHNNGNLLRLVELFRKFDSIMSEHIRRRSCKNQQHPYIDKDKQN